MKNIIYVLCLSFFPLVAQAQMFATEEKAPVQAPKVDNQSSSQNAGWGKFYNQNRTTDNTKNAAFPSIKKEEPKKAETTQEQPLKPPAKQVVKDPKDYVYKNVRQIDRPTLDGTKRGRTSVVPVVRDKNITGEGYIYVFYSDFSIHSSVANSTSCDVKFQVLTTLDRRLNALAIRLKWPSMETPLSFLDVNPNQEYHYSYTLLGDGCYSMDKIPNIVINRCRIKGMSQEECARKVRWIRKAY